MKSIIGQTVLYLLAISTSAAFGQDAPAGVAPPVPDTTPIPAPYLPPAPPNYTPLGPPILPYYPGGTPFAQPDTPILPPNAGGGAPATNPYGNQFTAAQGNPGSMNNPSNDNGLCYNNDNSLYLIQPINNIHSNTFQQHNDQVLTEDVPAGTGLLAPISNMQYADSRPFGGTLGGDWSLGFPNPAGPSNWAQKHIMGASVFLPDTGTGGVNIDTTLNWGY